MARVTSYPCNISVVHGFNKAVYTVEEGESITASFRQNVKGETAFPRLSLTGTISSELLHSTNGKYISCNYT